MTVAPVSAQDSNEETLTINDTDKLYWLNPNIGYDSREKVKDYRDDSLEELDEFLTVWPGDNEGYEYSADSESSNAQIEYMVLQEKVDGRAEDSDVDYPIDKEITGDSNIVFWNSNDNIIAYADISESEDGYYHSIRLKTVYDNVSVGDIRDNSVDIDSVKDSNSVKTDCEETEFNCPWYYTGGVSQDESDLMASSFYSLRVESEDSEIKFNHSASKDIYENYTLETNVSDKDISKITFAEGDDKHIAVNEVQVGSEEDDLTVSVPLPKAVDDLGIPFGSVVLFNVIIGFLGLLMALVPEQVFNAFDTFIEYVSSVIATAETTLGLAMEYVKFIQTVGLQRLKELLAVIGIVFGLRYVSVIKEASDGQRSYMSAVNYIVDDIVGKATSIERILYRAMDTITNITHLGFYLFEMVIKIYRTIKNHIPLIG